MFPVGRESGHFLLQSCRPAARNVKSNRVCPSFISKAEGGRAEGRKERMKDQG